MLIGHRGVVKVPARCTFKVQPLDVCINKPFKSIIRECWEDHVVKVEKDTGDDANKNPSFKRSSATRQDIVNWVHRGHVFLQESKAMIQCSREVCGITTTNPDLVRNDDFLKRIMAKAEVAVIELMMMMMMICLKIKTKYFLFNFCIQYLLVFVPFY